MIPLIILQTDSKLAHVFESHEGRKIKSEKVMPPELEILLVS